MCGRNLTRLLCVLALSAALACGEKKPGTKTDDTARPDRPGKKPHIALIMKAVSNPFFATMEKGAQQAAKDLDVTLTSLSVPKETDYEKQASFVENMVNQNVDAIVIAPANSKAIVAPLLKAQAKKIPIINIDNRIDAGAAKQAGLNVLTFIGPDNAEGAKKSAAYLIKAMGGKGKVAMLEGIRGVDNAEQRKLGFQQAVEATQDAVTIEAMESAEWATEQGNRKMAGILTRVADLNGVFCANDNMALGAIAAIEAAGKTGQVRITAYDNLKAAQEAILAGKLDATIEQHPDKMGYMGVENALKAIKGEQIPPEIPVPTDLITAETLKKATK